MKKLLPLFLLLLILATNHMYAQPEYWGVTFAGGKDFVFNSQQGIISNGLGVIFKTDKYGHNQQVVYNFDSSTGFRPDGMLTDGGNGKLYGFASQGGANEGGCLYEFDPITYRYRVIKSFSIAGGVYDALHAGANGGKLLLATNGKLYGTCTTAEYVPVAGCAQCPPVLTRYIKIFEYNIASDLFTEVYTFPVQTVISNGIMNGIRYAPSGPSRLVQASNGKVYISFQAGEEEFGNYVTASGRLYEFTPGTNQVTLLYNYPLNNGAAPGATWVEYTPGVLYNIFNYGNTLQMNKGGIHKYDISSHTMSIVSYVDTITGASISGTLVKAGDKLYGTTTLGGWAPVPWTPYYERHGIIFEFNPLTNEIKFLHDFFYEGIQSNIDTVNNPYYPQPNYYNDYGGLSLNLLGLNDTLFGISLNSMFWYKISTGEFKSLFNFAGLNGYFPQTGTGLIETCTNPYYTRFNADTTITVQPGKAFSFTLHTPNSDSLHWQKADVLINDADSILNFNSFALTDTGVYVCRLINECGTSVTKTIHLLAGSAIPVTLLNFTAILENKNALLSWHTGSEYNNSFFEIERSIDGVHFTGIGRINGNGSTSVFHSYTFTDYHLPNLETVYYRLKQIDFDRLYIYSHTVLLKRNPDAFSVSISPNPATSGFSILVRETPNEHVTITIFDSKGALIIRKLMAGGVVHVNSSKWASGEYAIKLTNTKGETVNKRVLINK